jgi:serine/threonine protein kinase
MIQHGTLLQNRYRVGEQIGVGGMGEVYVATDERFQSKVAIKRTFYNDPEMRRAFEREARLLNRLRHTALPKVTDYFSESDGQFLVMELIEGSNLSELLKQRKVPFPLTDVLRWADELLDALEYLHTQEPAVVHRDIKPQNIKLSTSGKVVLLDFGLAKGAPKPAQTASGTASSVFGYTLNFAPLEQMQGFGTDPRSDLYSLAATLYFLLTGIRPPDALTRASATVKNHPDPLRPAHLVQPQVPATVGQILHRALSQNAALRPASAAELRADLRRAANQAVTSEARSPVNSVNASAHSPLLSESLAVSIESPMQSPAQGQPAVQAREQSGNPLQTSDSSSTLRSKAPSRRDSQRESSLSDSYTMAAQSVVASNGVKANRTLLVVSLFIICAAASAYLLTRSHASQTPNAGAQTEVQNAAPPSQQVDRTERLTSAPNISASDAAHDASSQNRSPQSTSVRPASETPASNSQTAAQDSSKSDAGTLNQKASNALPESAKEMAASPNGKPTLVIQNPAPAASPTAASHHTEETRQQQMASRPESINQPPPGPVYPPPPGGWPPPPPDRRRPPPPRP